MKDIRLTIINRTIVSTAVALTAACGLFQSCTQDEFDEPRTDTGTLVDTGRYLVAKRVSPESRAESDVLSSRTDWFEPGTPYRLLAFTKPYVAADAMTQTDDAGYLRFNQVAWEGCTPDSLRYLNISQDPGIWFGFAAVDGERGGDDGRVSFDFYGFTYGVTADHSESYIPLTRSDGGDGGDVLPGKAVNPAVVYRYEPVVNGELPDLMWGECRNRNIATVTADNARSVIPFMHCFSRLRFIVVQQAPEDDDGNHVEAFPGIKVTDVKVKGTYTKAYVNLKDAKIKLPVDGETPVTRSLTLNESFKAKECVVTSRQVEMGQMLVYPTDGSVMSDDSMSAGFDTGLEITVQSDDRTVIEKFLANTNDADHRTVTENPDGTFSGTVIKEAIIDNYDEQHRPLRLMQGTSYTIVISFQQDAVRIVTVIPQVEEWLPGEGTTESPWQNQAMGLPQMFDNIYWSDRNLGADHYDPLGSEFEGTIGYFYQSGRNIPYYPFDTSLYKDSGRYPSWADNDWSMLADVKPYNSTKHKFYPIVDEQVLNMLHQTTGWSDSKNANSMWVMTDGNSPQMYIPEKKPDGKDGTELKYFDFMKGGAWGSGLATCNGGKGADIGWDTSARQPVAGGWAIPTASDFLRIFPSTPHAGNICFRGGGDNSNPMNSWGQYDLVKDVKTLRVTVPYYTPDMAEPTNRSDKYREAWRTLKSRNDPGTTHLDAYRQGYGPDLQTNRDTEPDGDPADGSASIYILSREEGSVGRLDDAVYNPDHKTYNPGAYVIKEWGTIYAIKRAYTSGAYRMRWRVVCAGLYGTGETRSPGLYIEICRYRCNSDARLTEDRYMLDYDWEHPAAVLYLPICGLGDHDGYYINFGTECQYAVSDKASGWRVPGVHVKISGDNYANLFMAVVNKPVFNRSFAKQIRPVMK